MHSFLITKDKLDGVMTGKERYPIIGTTAVPYEKILEILESFEGMSLYWDCLEKAQKAREILKIGTVTLGEFTVISGNYTSSYGYLYHPPYEFHAWLSLGGDDIFDPALPGVIKAGMETKDQYGPILTGRIPCILNGIPKKYMIYRAKEVL